MTAFATYPPHEHVGCFNCATSLQPANQGIESQFAVGRGARQQQCPACEMRTFYDVLSVHESNAGFYIGLLDPNEGPVSRESGRYWPNRQQAITALETGHWPRNRA